MSDSREDVTGCVEVGSWVPESDTRALWAVRVIDKWAEKVGMKAPPRPERVYGPSGTFLHFMMSNMWGLHTGATPDAARIAAAEALVVEDPTLGEGL